MASILRDVIGVHTICKGYQPPQDLPISRIKPIQLQQSLGGWPKLAPTQMKVYQITRGAR